MALYKHTQYGKFLITIFTITPIIILLLYFFNPEDRTILLSTLLIIAFVSILTILLFYKLTITITKDIILAKFGIGLIKKSMAINTIDFDSIENIRIPWYYGIGIRITPHGKLFNVKTGNAIKIKSRTKTFLVGTSDFENIYSVLKGLKNN